MRGGFSSGMGDLKALDKQLLVERHLISREHAAKGGGSALVLNKDETLSVMVNEEDHLRMQALLPGCRSSRFGKRSTGLTRAWRRNWNTRMTPATAI